MTTYRLRWQLAIGQAAIALVLLLAGTIVLVRRTDDLRRKEATVGAQRDAEALSADVAPRLGANPTTAPVPTESTTRRVELIDARGKHLSGSLLTTDPGIAKMVEDALLNAGTPASSVGTTSHGMAVGIEALVNDDGVAGILLVAEPLPARRGFPQLYGLDPIAAAALAILAAAMGWWLAGLITKPLGRLTERARSLVLSGDTGPPPRSRITEVAVLSTAIERVGSQIRHQQQAREGVESNLRRLSHELRTPLTTIRLWLDDLTDSDGEFVDDQRRAGPSTTSRTDTTLHIIGGQLDRLDGLGAQLSQLRYARPEATEIDLSALSAIAIDRLRPLAAWGRVELRTGTHPPAPVMAERSALEDAIANVIENAIKYSPRGSRVKIDVTADDEWCTLEIGDSGPGIAAELRDVIRRPGVRILTSNMIRGTGQGLAIVAATLDRAGGRLEFAATASGGALVKMVLPNRSSTDQETPDPTAAGAAVIDAAVEPTADRPPTAGSI